MSNLIKINTTLVKADASIQVANKLLRTSNFNVVLFDCFGYIAKRKEDTLVYGFIKRNFWYFIEAIVRKIKWKTFENEKMPKWVIEQIDNNALYEYPRAIYKQRSASGNKQGATQAHEISPKLDLFLIAEIVLCLDRGCKLNCVKVHK